MGEYHLCSVVMLLHGTLELFDIFIGEGFAHPLSLIFSEHGKTSSTYFSSIFRGVPYTA